MGQYAEATKLPVSSPQQPTKAIPATTTLRKPAVSSIGSRSQAFEDGD
jgi:hypothetical protein